MSTIAWKPFIEPDSLEIGPNGRKVAFHTIPGSGWWRTGQQHSSDGAFVGVESEKPLKDVESFKIEASLKIKGADIQLTLHDTSLLCPFYYSDQGCLFLYVTGTLWLKAGLEHVNGKIRVSCVVTDPYADWSLDPAEVNIDYKQPHTFTIEIMEQEQEPLPLIRISYNGRVLREVPAFGLAQGQMERKFRVGLMGCSPMSNGCMVHFDEISIEGAIEQPSAGDNCFEASAKLV